MNEQERVRELLLEQLSGKNGHVDFSTSVEGLPIDTVGRKPEGFDHSIWELVEHIRISQHDILEFSRNPDYESPDWPQGYWPNQEAPKSKAQWEKCVQAIARDQQGMVNLIQNSGNDLLALIPHGEGQTLFREAMLIVDHNAYHIGQIVQLRKALGIW